MGTVVSLIMANKLVILGALPMCTRAYYALKNGGGLVGIWNSIMFGTNTPKK